ncbi:hypothetical protein B0J12DRAFT_540460, partial [Macrophomina phaseolina]
LSAADLKLIKDFHRELGKDKLETCTRCQERWFNMKLDDFGVCSRCRYRRDQGKADDMPFLFSDANSLDPGEMPDASLPQLTQVEEMLISRVHVHIEVRQIRG